MQGETFSANRMMPEDWLGGRFLGRALLPEGPSPILIENGRAYDMARVAPTVSGLIEANDLDAARGVPVEIEELRLISPIDLQCVKASGVTFAVSAIERVIEEHARGDASAAAAVRGRLETWIGGSIRSLMPGSEEAAALKAALIEDGIWSQYLEVAIAPTRRFSPSRRCYRPSAGARTLAYVLIPPGTIPSRRWC